MKPKQQKMKTLTYDSTVRVERHVRSHADRRRYVDRHIFTYYADNGDEHRIVREVACDAACTPAPTVDIPDRGPLS